MMNVDRELLEDLRHELTTLHGRRDVEVLAGGSHYKRQAHHDA